MAERHPIQPGRGDLSQEERLHHLEAHLAMLWDQVWWMSLPPKQRWKYRQEGFKDPIEKFYIEE